MKVRTHVVFAGRVQGVFFRMNTQKKATELGIKGFVRNVFDGTVEAVFEGEESGVKEVIDWCEKKIPMARVDDVKVEWLEFKDEFDSFDVVRSKF